MDVSTHRELFAQLLGVKLNQKATKQQVLCPFHEDKNPSMSLDFVKGVWFCHACKEGGNIYQLAFKLGKKITPDNQLVNDFNEELPKQNKSSKHSKPRNFQPEKYTLQTYADEKALDMDFLTEQFYLTDDGNKLIIPYYNTDGELQYYKYRIGRKMWTEKNIEIIPYGLWLLDSDGKDTIWIVEGESDTQTLWQNGIPALGIPGVNTLRPEFLEHIQDFKQWIFVIERDKGGRVFLENIYSVLLDFFPEKLSSSFIVLMSDMHKKDINEIWKIKPEKRFFLEKLDFLFSIKLLLPVAYEHFINLTKWIQIESRRIAVHIYRQHKFAIKNELLWIWKDNLYEVVKNEDKFYRTFLTQSGINKSTKLQQVKNHIESFILSAPQPKDPGVEWIHFKNVSVNYKTLEEKQFGSDYFISIRIPYNWNTSRKSQFVDEMFSDWVDDVELLYSLIGYTFLRSYTGNLFFILYGVGNNGKTTFLELLKRILNGLDNECDNVSAISLEQILNDRFASSMLYDKLANISGEMSYSKITNTTFLKDVTGDGTITAQYKYGKQFTFKTFAKLIFATNKIPPTTDTTPGFYRRVVIIPFKIIPPQKEKMFILEELTQNDYEYIIYRSMLALRNLAGKNFKIYSINESQKMYEDLSNPIKFYLETMCEVTKDPDDWIHTIDFVERFKKWLTQTKQPLMSTFEIYREMQEMGFEKTRVYNMEGKRVQAFVGIRYKTNDEEIPF